MARISLLCLAISILFSQTAYAQPSIRLGLGYNKMVSISDKLSTSSIDVTSYHKIGLVWMAGLELQVSPVASLLLEGAYIANGREANGLSVSQTNVGIKLTSPLLYVVSVIGYNRATVQVNSSIESTEKNIGAGAGVGLNFRKFFSEARVYHSRAAESTYLLGIVGMQKLW